MIAPWSLKSGGKVKVGEEGSHGREEEGGGGGREGGAFKFRCAHKCCGLERNC